MSNASSSGKKNDSSLQNNWHEFSQSTTIHGISYVDRSNSKFEKCCWLSVLVIAVIVMVVQFASLLNEFRAQHTGTIVEVQDLSDIEKMADDMQPVYCPQDWLNMTKVEESKIDKFQLLYAMTLIPEVDYYSVKVLYNSLGKEQQQRVSVDFLSEVTTTATKTYVANGKIVFKVDKREEMHSDLMTEFQEKNISSVFEYLSNFANQHGIKWGTHPDMTEMRHTRYWIRFGVVCEQSKFIVSKHLKNMGFSYVGLLKFNFVHDHIPFMPPPDYFLSFHQLEPLPVQMDSSVTGNIQMKVSNCQFDMHLGGMFGGRETCTTMLEIHTRHKFRISTKWRTCFAGQGGQKYAEPMLWAQCAVQTCKFDDENRNCSRFVTHIPEFQETLCSEALFGDEDAVAESGSSNAMHGNMNMAVNSDAAAPMHGNMMIKPAETTAPISSKMNMKGSAIASTNGNMAMNMQTTAASVNDQMMPMMQMRRRRGANGHETPSENLGMSGNTSNMTDMSHHNSEMAKFENLQFCLKECSMLFPCESWDFEWMRGSQIHDPATVPTNPWGFDHVVSLYVRTVMRFTEYRRMPLMDFIGGIGGSMGLFLGASIISFVQLLMYLCFCCGKSCCSRANQIKVKPPNAANVMNTGVAPPSYIL